MEERRRCGLPIHTVGLPQARQPLLGQIHATRGNPDITFKSGPPAQVIDRRDIPQMHQALGLGQGVKGLGGTARLLCLECRQQAVTG